MEKEIKSIDISWVEEGNAVKIMNAGFYCYGIANPNQVASLVGAIKRRGFYARRRGFYFSASDVPLGIFRTALKVAKIKWEQLSGLHWAQYVPGDGYNHGVQIPD